MDANKNYFIEGVGTAQVTGADGSLSLIHLQSMSVELSSTMEKIFGGEGNFPLYTYQTEKSVKATFKNASWNLHMVTLTQGVKNADKPTLIANEVVTVGASGSLTLSHASTADMSTLVVSTLEGIVIPVTSGSVAASFSGKKVRCNYTYEDTGSNAVGSNVLTTSVPGFVTIMHRSKAMPQDDGHVYRIHTVIWKARCDGSLTYNEEHKNAFAPELKFEVIDPKRADHKLINFAIEDVTGKEEAGVAMVDDGGEG